MEYLSEEHVRLLLTKEWLAKSDSESSTPYLLKFYASTVDISCCILITDTKSVWAEVLSSNQFARRWRDCNPKHSSSVAGEDPDEEESWRIQCLEFVTTAHSLGGIADLSFELVKTNYSDIAFTVGTDSFRWQWEAFSVGPRLSADILSKQLILPLISMTHLAFASVDPVGTTSEAELEKSVDKIGRTARRTIDTHVRNALSRPLLATTLRRITAMFNFVPDLPRILAYTAAPDFTPPSPPSRVTQASKPPLRRAATPSPPPSLPARVSSPVLNTHNKPTSKVGSARSPKPQPPDDDSATEEEPEEEEPKDTGGKNKGAQQDRRSASTKGESPAQVVPSKRASLDSPPPADVRSSPPPASSSPLPPPQKKGKRAKAAASSSDDEDSEGERKKRLARLKGAANSSRGAKQPLKRGGKRF